MSVIDHVRDMAAAGLHSNVRLLSSLLLTMSNNNPELFSPSQKYQLLVYHADSLFHDKEYRNAVSKYTMALQQKKALSKTSKVRPSTGNSASTPQSQCLPSEIEVKYKMAECYTMLKLDKDAIAILDGIPSRQRTPKTGFLFETALARLATNSQRSTYLPSARIKGMLHHSPAVTLILTLSP